VTSRLLIEIPASLFRNRWAHREVPQLATEVNIYKFYISDENIFRPTSPCDAGIDNLI
jgi:hypothetical protein